MPTKCEQSKIWKFLCFVFGYLTLPYIALVSCDVTLHYSADRSPLSLRYPPIALPWTRRYALRIQFQYTISIMHGRAENALANAHTHRRANGLTARYGLHNRRGWMADGRLLLLRGEKQGNQQGEETERG